MNLQKLSFFITVLFIFTACQQQRTNTGEKEDVLTTVPDEPAFEFRKDLDAIRKDGVLHAITIYNSFSYFLYRGKPMGFEYELLSRLAKDLGLELKITVAEDIDDLFKMLNNGEGDLIAFGLTITEPRKELVSFTESHYNTYQTLVQRKPENWRSLPPYKVEKQLISNTLELINDTVWTRENSSYAERLKNLENEMGADIKIQYVPGNLTTDEIIKMVADGEIDRTVADYNIAAINKTYNPNLHIETRISFAQRIAWAVRKNSPDLLEAVNNWIEEEKQTDDYYVIYNKYFKNKKSYTRRIRSDFYSKNGNKISKYDDLIKDYAADINWDWRFLCSQVYQESRFNPKAESWAGAGGLIQLMPTTAEALEVEDVFNPEENLEGGVTYLKRIRNRFDAVKDSIQKIKFTLAAFNSGPGHVFDAMRLAEKHGKNPHIWDDHVEEFMLKLSEKQYYLDPVVDHGFVRGSQPYTYVKDIFMRYDHYKKFISK
ncbi:transporter substrate-binding domain-containing protein [Robertkochia marina]|uniref:Transporter substrate-binding domain-containing protein n=1 Tax=Robertkochia marina TaxID=1227945 RepID=A0A4S3LYW9_9FLAO|nr:transporter substrate-binding domain-containing protein [Robertkochia marina]THD66810.1 transporter substrate-binding domain-containing protein [Robertkochia marina]TRZ41899.1 lytic transglycosylase F [Robertkochia marina]